MKRNITKPAFSLLTTIFIILLMATVAAFIMNLSGKMVQETVTQYKKEQAILYAKSYTEFAIMSATARNCIDEINGDIGANPANGIGYRVVVDVQYVGNDLFGLPNCNTIGPNPISTVSSKGSVILLDTYVQYRDPSLPNVAIAPWITYHRRTLQRL